jgi:2-polyprenyl-3-methyl-5-hydroxy-6-metoxy-1,4-benzoquinol methylase
MAEPVKEPRVLVVVPNTGFVHIGLAHVLLEILGGTKHQYMFIQDKPVENVRNKACLMMRQDDFDFLLMIDNDTVPTGNPLDLMALDKDVMIFPTLMFKLPKNLMEMGGYPFAWNAMDWVEDLGQWREHIPRDGLQEIDAGGTGCIMIARRVLEHPEMRHPFTRVWNPDGECTVGSDLFFCKRAKEQGFRVWAHYDYRCRHVKQIELLELQTVTGYRDIVHANQPNINTPDYWNDQWQELGKPATAEVEGADVSTARKRPYYDDVLELCPKGGSVLDFGCGRGDLLELLAKKTERAIGIDQSQAAVDICRERGLTAIVGTEIPELQMYDTIVATEVLECMDDDEAFIQECFKHTNRLIYAVPFNCYPPSIEPGNRRCYTRQYIQRITPHLKRTFHREEFIVVVAERETDGGNTRDPNTT